VNANVQLFFATWSEFVEQGQRVGQAAYNAAHEVWPGVVEILHGTVLDPFQYDDRVPAFLHIVLANPVQVPQLCPEHQREAVNAGIRQALDKLDGRAEVLADAFEALGEDTEVEAFDAEPLREIRAAVAARLKAEQAVLDAVAKACRAGLSWAAIGSYLGTSGEAARQRYTP
jgi:hypothetical protein